MQKRWKHADYQLNKWWPEFNDCQVEKKYRTQKFSQDARSIARGIFVLSIFFMAFVISDQFIEFVDESSRQLNMLLKFSMAVVGLAFYQYISRNLNPTSVHNSVLFFIGVFCFGSFLTFAIYATKIIQPVTLLEMSVAFAYLSLLIYIFVPLTFSQQLMAASGVVLTWALLLIEYFSISDPRLGFGAMFILLGNIFGISVSFTINKNFRLAWASEVEKEKDCQQLKIEIKRREKAETQLKKLAMTDPLTGVENRRSFMEHLGREKKRADRQFTPLSIINFDIDLFKHINDQFGHEVGDKVLIEITQLVEERHRETDVFARIGGEEFAILMPDSDLKNAQQLAESIRQAVSEKAIVFDGKIIKVTASFGVAEYKTHEAIDILLRRADKAMYDAKNAGRNRVSINYK